MTDRDIQKHVQEALDWEPSVEASELGVTVHEGVVTLRGDVGTFREKQVGERVALGVMATNGRIATSPKRRSRLRFAICVRSAGATRRKIALASRRQGLTLGLCPRAHA